MSKQSPDPRPKTQDRILPPTMAMLAEKYKAHLAPRVAPGSLSRIDHELRRFALFVGRKEMSARVIHDFVDEQFKRTSEAWGLSTCFSWVRRLLQWCEECGHLDRRYSALLPTIKPPEKPALRFTPEQYEKLKEVTKGTPWHYASIMAYRTGARLSDVCLLKWEHVNFEQLVIRYVPFKSRKTGRYATCPFLAGGDLHDVLLELHKARHPSPKWSQFVCPDMAMSYPTHDADNGRSAGSFRKYCVLIGAPKLSFHKLRNSFMSRLVNGGIPFAQARQITGLGSDQVFLRYAKPDLQVLRKAIETIDNAEAPTPPDNVLKLPAQASSG